MASRGSPQGVNLTDPSAQTKRRRGRDANVYEAVAGQCYPQFLVPLRLMPTNPAPGRVTTTLPIERGHNTSLEGQGRRPPSDTVRDSTLAPEDVLFRRRNAPVRFAEKDIYHAHEGLSEGGRAVLPDSDMLKAIHSYASDFYEALADQRAGKSASGQRRNPDERSMDETALLALGILLEEAGREVLGKGGDLVFTEGVEASQDADNKYSEDDHDGNDAEVVGFKSTLK
ncbi:hypothetical protein GGR56DRAFT_576686 [Xylariaceae sp. FL0804]|nr:hypothetical protein GGR56DRAFT_576686 [Xylariaceae sp. FL0804]